MAKASSSSAAILREARAIRAARPVLGCCCRPYGRDGADGTDGIDAIVDLIDREVLFTRAARQDAG